ncbi:unnamed protein product, partial [Prorocentrum cordatum]
MLLRIAHDDFDLMGRESTAGRRSQPTVACLTDCCFKGLDLYGMGAIGVQHQNSEKDYHTYEPEAYRRLREGQLAYEEQEASPSEDTTHGVQQVLSNRVQPLCFQKYL